MLQADTGRAGSTGWCSSAKNRRRGGFSLSVFCGPPRMSRATPTGCQHQTRPAEQPALPRALLTQPGSTPGGTERPPALPAAGLRTGVSELPNPPDAPPCCRRGGLREAGHPGELCWSYSLLHLAQLHSHNQLRLGGHVLEDVRLEPPQHVGTQQIVELFDLVLLGDVCKLLQEPLQVTVKAARTTQC